MQTNHPKENKRIFVLLVLFFLAAVVVVFHTHNSFGGGDYYSHFRLARWGWKYPQLLFDEWGKPIFTLLVSPFAQLGINFARLYNVLAGLITALLTWKLSQRLGFSDNWLVTILVLFVPVYFISLFAVLTEVTFSAFLMLALYLFFKKKYVASAVIISLLPLARTESVVLFPLFILSFALKKQWKALPFFLTGFLIFSLAGWPFYKNFFYLITQMPYKGGTATVYGHGSLFHFIRQTNRILGYPVAGLFLIGWLASLWQWGKNDHFRINQHFFFLLLVPGSYLLYLAAHSYVWWKGIGNSLGLIRVMAAVTPLASLTALYGLNILKKPLSKHKNVLRAGAVLFFAWIMYEGTTCYKENFHLSRPEQVLAKACRFIKEKKLDRYKIYYFSNFVPYKLGIDPFDKRRIQERLPQYSRNVSSILPDSSIIVWDAHFGPNEGKTPLNKLLNDKGLRLLRVFKPQHPFNVLGGYPYAVYIFQRTASSSAVLQNRMLDFEEKTDERNFCYSDKQAHSGRYSLKMDHTVQFSPGFQIPVGMLLRKKIKGIRASVWIYSQFPYAEMPVSLVVSFQHGNHPYNYHALNLNDSKRAKKLKPFRWERIEITCLLPQEIQKPDIIKIYVWNRAQKPFYIDDLNVTFF